MVKHKPVMSIIDHKYFSESDEPVQKLEHLEESKMIVPNPEQLEDSKQPATSKNKKRKPKKRKAQKAQAAEYELDEFLEACIRQNKLDEALLKHVEQ